MCPVHIKPMFFVSRHMQVPGESCQSGGTGRAGFQLQAQNLLEPQGSLNPILVYALTLAEEKEENCLVVVVYMQN